MIETTLRLRRMLRDEGLKPWPKLTGGKGLPGTWRVQPIHIGDLTAIVERLLERPPPWPRRLDLVGPEPVDTDRLIAAFRDWLGQPPRPFFPLPVPLLRTAAWLGDRLGAGSVTGESLTMLMHGNTAPVAPLLETTGYTLIITSFLPEAWLHPFGPVTKNVPLALATLVMMAVED